MEIETLSPANVGGTPTESVDIIALLLPAGDRKVFVNDRELTLSERLELAQIVNFGTRIITEDPYVLRSAKPTWQQVLSSSTIVEALFIGDRPAGLVFAVMIDNAECYKFMARCRDGAIVHGELSYHNLAAAKTAVEMRTVYAHY